MGVELFYKVYPNAHSNQHIVILHGLFGMLDNWHNMAKKLSNHYNVVLVDQRNHGKSPHSAEMSYELMAGDLAQLLDHLNLEKVILLGHSMGGKTAMKFADLHPGYLEKLVVVDIGPKAYKPGHTKYFEAFNAIDFSAYDSRKDIDKAFQQFESNLAIRQFLLKNMERDEDGYKTKFNLKAIEQFYPELIGSIEFQWIINVPTLFLYGSRSNYVVEDDFAAIESVFTDVDFVAIEDAGHWVHAEKPNAFYEALIRFINE